MKIDGSTLSAYALSRQRTATADNSLSGDTGGGGGSSSGRNIPTVEPTAAMPSGLANALWLTTAKLEKSGTESDDLLSEFMDLAKMTPIERLRKELLEKMGLTEDSLAQMPEEQRAAIEEEIRRAIKERLGIDDTQHAGAMEGQSTAGTPEAEA
ncbi:hypothetical protein [Shinella fusca]|jgi:hypothetical protein|uniref:Uncharacterized protein n=1 Tax=Shinella fusca TaxID=544480 RepID=A0A7W7YYI4_9HYPH|nr:hypothetical protein [Shinella fusca]MBB5044564.1 hypothetical protein [Shinella fusca]